MNVTKDVAFAFLKSLEDHDIEWLNGDYSTLLDQLTPDTLEGNIYNATQDIMELNTQLANGQVDADTYSDKMLVLYAELAKAKRESRENLFGVDGVADSNMDSDGYLEANQKVITLMNDLSNAAITYQSALDVVNKAEQAGREATEEELNNVQMAKTIYETTQSQLESALEVRNKFAEPTEAEIAIAIEDIDAELAEAGNKFDEALVSNFHLDKNNCYVINTGVDMSALEATYPGLQNYINLLNSRTQLTAYANSEPADLTLNDIGAKLDGLAETMNSMTLSLDAKSVESFSAQLGELCKPRHIKTYLQAFWGGITSNEEGGSTEGEGNVNGTANIFGTAHAKGTAYKSGNWGLPNSEHNSLVGELGQELVVNPRTGRYYTVGDNGAEMVDLPKDAIIFNHKQTEGLLKNGHISSRGRAYAEGNAHVTIWPTGASGGQWDTASSSLSNAADSVSDAADEFREVFDWIEVRLEEINEAIDLKSAQLENKVGYAAQNKTIDTMLEYHKSLYENLIAGANKYYAYAKTLLAKVPAEYRAAAKDGTIAIETFVGEVDEKTLEAIKDYRDWVQRGADATQQAEETLTAIRDLAIQKIDNAQGYADVRVSIQDAQTDKLQNVVDYDEERGLVTSAAYYEAMKVNAKQSIGYLTTARDEMQKEFDEAVKSGEIKRGSTEWYEQIEKLYDMDAQIAEANIEIEEFQNKINDIYWDNFDNLINQFEYLENEAENLIDILGQVDMVSEDGTWTDEGIAAMGLYAQQMQIAEIKVQSYAEAIEDLNADYKAGKYSQSEYLEKLDDLKSAQADEINKMYEAKQAIVDLNKERIDAIKDGIEKEIEAYEELIDKKKEDLDVEKDLYDFQKNAAEGQKNIADIERKLAALSGDSSAAGIAKRKQLEAELAEARQAQEDLYYERSITNRQDALDTELESFTDEKEAEIEKWEEYLEDIEQVVADSLAVVLENANGIAETLTDKATEYNLTLSDAILSPWADGASAIGEYTTAFGDSYGSTMTMLNSIKDAWQDIIDAQAQAGRANISSTNAENQKYAAATYEQPKTTTSTTTNASTSTLKTQAKAITVGGKINAKGAKIYGYVGDTSGDTQYYASDPIYVVLDEQKGYLKVRHHKSSSGVTGWFKKSDVKAYAKGSLSIPEDQWAWIDELGEELQLVPDGNGRLSYMKKGTGVVPADLTERLMDLAMNPQEVLDRNRPQITPSKSIVNNNMEIHVDASVGEVIHVEHLDGGNLDAITKVVNKAWDKKMEGLNNAMRKFTR